MITKTLIQVDSGKAWASPEQAQTLAMLVQARKGGYARVYGYESTSGRVTPQVADITFTTRFSYLKSNQRKKEALKAMTLAEVLGSLNSPKVKAMPLSDLQLAFDARKQAELDSFELTANNVRNDAHRQGHDRCYINLAEGVVVHLDTSKDDNGLMQPIITDGFPSVKSIMMNVLEVSKTVRIKGEYKTVNSGVPVLIGNAIKAQLKAVGVRSLKRISLVDGKFERVAIDNDVILSEDIVALA